MFVLKGLLELQGGQDLIKGGECPLNEPLLFLYADICAEDKKGGRCFTSVNFCSTSGIWDSVVCLEIGGVFPATILIRYRVRFVQNFALIFVDIQIAFVGYTYIYNFVMSSIL